LNWLLVFLLSHLPAPPDKALLVNGFAPEPEAYSADYVLSNYLETSRRNFVRGASMEASFSADLPNLERSATLMAHRTVGLKGDIHYDVLRSGGDTAIKKEVIARYMAAEVDPPATLPTDVAITPANYKFKARAIRERDGQRIFVYEVSPRKKRVGLFKGEIWVDAETGLTLRESGTFVKSPSVFLKKVQFVREFDLRDGYSVPRRIETNMITRFWGPARLTVEFSDFTWNGSLASTWTPVAAGQ